MAVVCDRFAMSEMSFDQEGLRHVKCEPFVVAAGVLAGKYEISIDDEEIVVKPGEWYVSNSYAHRIIVHRRAGNGPMQARWFKVRYALRDGTDFCSLWEFPKLCKGDVAKQLTLLWDKGQQTPHSSPAMAAVATQSVAMQLLEVLCAAGNPVEDWEQKIKSARRFSKVARYVDAHLTSNLSPAELARAMSVSESHLYTLFRNDIGMSPAVFVKHRRIHAACELLEGTNKSVKEIAARVGFANPYHFSREFRAIRGVSPTQYRQQEHA